MGLRCKCRPCSYEVCLSSTVHGTCLTVGSPVPQCVLWAVHMNFRLLQLVSGNTWSFFSCSFELLFKAISALGLQPYRGNCGCGPSVALWNQFTFPSLRKGWESEVLEEEGFLPLCLRDMCFLEGLVEFHPYECSWIWNSSCNSFLLCSLPHLQT